MRPKDISVLSSSRSDSSLRFRWMGFGSRDVKLRRRMAWVILTLSLGGFVLLNAWNGRLGMADFQVYFEAAGRWMEGENPYGRAYGLSSGFYKYAPLALVPWVLLQPLGFSTCSSLYLLLLLVSMIWMIPKMVSSVYRMMRFDQVRLGHPTAWTFALFALLCLQHLSRELLLGNVNWILLLGISFWWLGIRKPKREVGHAVRYGLLLAIICLFKPHFAILLPWLGWRRPRRYLIWTLTMGLTLLCLPSLWLGVEPAAKDLYDWAGALLAHNSANVSSFNTFSGLVGWANNQSMKWVPPMVVMSILIFWIGRQRQVDRHLEVREVCVLIGMIPNLVLTDTEHFMFSFPWLAWWCVVMTSKTFWKKMPKWDRWLTTGVFALMMVPYALASPDLWGSELGGFLEHKGPLGIANLFLVLGGVWTHHIYTTTHAD